MDNYDRWLETQEEQFESQGNDDEPTKEDLIEVGVLSDDED